MEKGNGEAVLEHSADGGAVEPENSSCVVGRLTRNADVRTAKNGRKRAFFTLAVPRTPTPGKNDKADYIPVVFWEAAAERCASLGKGSLVRVQGKLRSWVGKDERTRVEIQGELLEIVEERQPAPEGAQAGSA